MCEEWMPTVTIALSDEQYEQLPRNSAYQYDYLRGTAFLTPRPKHFHGVLDLARWQPPEDAETGVAPRPLADEDKATLPELFADAFERVQPFSGLTKERRQTAARVTLEKTWQGSDGPWLRQASFCAFAPNKKEPVGAVAVTLVPGGDPGKAESYRWHEPVDDKAGQPHLTWIFVAPAWKGTGVGSALLGHAVAALRELGHGSLWSTFMAGNDASTLWHWRNGFTLAPFPMSRRKSRRL